MSRAASDYATFNPATDPLARGGVTTPKNRTPRRAPKASCSASSGLELDIEKPLVLFAGPLDAAHGADLVLAALPELLRQRAALVVATTEPGGLIAEFRAAAAERPESLAVVELKEHGALRRLYAAADLALVIPRDAPCETAQLVAQRYGALPVALAAGIAGDTIVDADAALETGTGFLFDRPERAALVGAVERALASMAGGGAVGTAAATRDAPRSRLGSTGSALRADLPPRVGSSVDLKRNEARRLFSQESRQSTKPSTASWWTTSTKSTLQAPGRDTSRAPASAAATSTRPSAPAAGSAAPRTTPRGASSNAVSAAVRAARPASSPRTEAALAKSRTTPNASTSRRPSRDTPSAIKSARREVAPTKGERSPDAASAVRNAMLAWASKVRPLSESSAGARAQARPQSSRFDSAAPPGARDEHQAVREDEGDHDPESNDELAAHERHHSGPECSHHFDEHESAWLEQQPIAFRETGDARRRDSRRNGDGQQHAKAGAKGAFHEHGDGRVLHGPNSASASSLTYVVRSSTRGVVAPVVLAALSSRSSSRTTLCSGSMTTYAGARSLCHSRTWSGPWPSQCSRRRPPVDIDDIDVDRQLERAVTQDHGARAEPLRGQVRRGDRLAAALSIEHARGRALGRALQLANEKIHVPTRVERLDEHAPRVLAEELANHRGEIFWAWMPKAVTTRISAERGLETVAPVHARERFEDRRRA